MITVRDYHQNVSKSNLPFSFGSPPFLLAAALPILTKWRPGPNAWYDDSKTLKFNARAAIRQSPTGATELLNRRNIMSAGKIAERDNKINQNGVFTQQRLQPAQRDKTDTASANDWCLS